LFDGVLDKHWMIALGAAFNGRQGLEYKKYNDRWLVPDQWYWIREI